MLTFLKRLFGASRVEEIDPELIIEESWQTDFRKPDTARFPEEAGDSYSTRIADSGLCLTLTRPKVFAWTVDPLYRYRDFVLEGLVVFPVKDESATGEDAIDAEARRAGGMASGFLFRYLNEGTFYAVLVSDRGMVRMDAVVNGTPIPVLGWTETRRGSPEVNEAFSEEAPYANDDRTYSLRIIARATGFTIVVNDAWVAECADDTIQAAGKIAFAAQNWESGAGTEAILSAIAIDSAAIDVETAYARWNQYIPIGADSRVALAKTWYAMGKYVPAILELRRARKERPADADEHLLAGQAFLAQRLYAEAEESIRDALALDGTNEAAIADLGGLLYLQNRFAELEALLLSAERASIDRSPFLSNLEGHLLSWKGSRGEAATAYLRAARLADGQGLFYLHAGNELAASGDRDAAVDAWLDAARAFLAANENDDLGDAVERLLEIAGTDARSLALAGKHRYAIGDEKAAADFLDRAIGLRSEDSAVWYLRGMIHSSRGDAKKAIESFRKAATLEEGFGLYRFRLAEALFNAGEDCSEELARAMETAGDSGWTWNLASMKALSEGNPAEAERCSVRARELLPGELAPLVNLAEALRRDGRLDEAIPLFDRDEGESLKALANLLVEDGRHEEADDLYLKALKQRPFDAELLTDRAANCLELDLLSEADDLLGRAIEIAPTPRIYRLIAYLSGRKGEYARAEVALLRGLDVFPEATDLLYELASVYQATGKRDKAAETVRRLRERGDSDRARELAEEIEDSATYVIACASCDRHWRIPKNIPPQGSLRITAEPPDDLPAGTCPRCEEHYCIGCARKNLDEDGRFRCAKCGERLKLVNQGIIWTLSRWQEAEEASTDARGKRDS
jgi:tetratricopeptide (TPR) repeat protein